VSGSRVPCTQGSTYTKACNLGIRTARLPIAEHLNVKMANSLAINHGMRALSLRHSLRRVALL